MVTVFEGFFQLEYSESYAYNMHRDARIQGYHYCMPFETLLALNYNSFILTVGIIGVDSHVRDMYGDSHSQGTSVLLEIPSMLKLVQYFQKQASQASVHNSINTIPEVKSKTICFSSLTYISTVLNDLHQGEWPLQALHTIITR